MMANTIFPFVLDRIQSTEPSQYTRFEPEQSMFWTIRIMSFMRLNVLIVCTCFQTKGAAAKDLGSLKDYTILAMSNLLSANVDAGLKYSLSMGYHEDTRTRTAFMQVLTNILNQGTEFETLAETALTDRYEKLVDVRKSIFY